MLKSNFFQFIQAALATLSRAFVVLLLAGEYKQFQEMNRMSWQLSWIESYRRNFYINPNRITFCVCELTSEMRTCFTCNRTWFNYLIFVSLDHFAPHSSSFIPCRVSITRKVNQEADQRTERWWWSARKTRRIICIHMWNSFHLLPPSSPPPPRLLLGSVNCCLDFGTRTRAQIIIIKYKLAIDTCLSANVCLTNEIFSPNHRQTGESPYFDFSAPKCLFRRISPNKWTTTMIL